MDAAIARAVPIFGPMGTIAITPAAFASIALRPRPDSTSGYLITLPHGVIDCLGAMRGRGESYRAGPVII
ncbi:MAG TPA: hypothetical protein VFE60_23755 [Roseiarcus sp.]|jgi:hypothetical protein|nr:hypothetical protein [Roseiarcus sp.]